MNDGRPSMSAVTVHHNPACSNSRAALALIRERGIEPRVVDYLKTPLSVDELRTLVARVGVPVRALLRAKEAAYAELGLADLSLGDDALFAAIAAHPILLNRPIVVTPLGARLCRPPETVREILPAA